MTIGEKLKTARLAAGLSLAEVARRVGTTRQHVHTWEVGHYKPSGKYLRSLSSVLDVSIWELVSDEVLEFETAQWANLETLLEHMPDECLDLLLELQPRLNDNPKIVTYLRHLLQSGLLDSDEGVRALHSLAELSRKGSDQQKENM